MRIYANLCAGGAQARRRLEKHISLIPVLPFNLRKDLQIYSLRPISSIKVRMIYRFMKEGGREDALRRVWNRAFICRSDKSVE